MKEFSRKFYLGSGIYLTPGAASFVTSGANLDGAEGVYVNVAAGVMNFKSLHVTGLLGITSDAVSILFSTTAEINTASNVGAGSGWYASKVGSDLRFKSITVSGGLSKSESATEVNVSASGVLDGLIKYTFSSSTSDSDPGNGYFRVNNATPAIATFIYIDTVDVYAAPMGAIIAGLVSGSTLYIKGINSLTSWQVWNVTGPVTTASGYYKIPVTLTNAGATAFNNNDVYEFNVFGAMPASLINTGGVIKLESTALGIIDQEHAISTDMHGVIMATGSSPFLLQTISIFGRQAVAANCAFDIGCYDWSSGGTVNKLGNGTINMNLAANTISGGSVTLGTPLVLTANTTYFGVVTASNVNFALYSKSGGLASANQVTFLKAGVGASLPATITFADRGNSGRAIYMKWT